MDFTSARARRTAAALAALTLAGALTGCGGGSSSRASDCGGSRAAAPAMAPAAWSKSHGSSGHHSSGHSGSGGGTSSGSSSRHHDDSDDGNSSSGHGSGGSVRHDRPCPSHASGVTHHRTAHRGTGHHRTVHHHAPGTTTRRCPASRLRATLSTDKSDRPDPKQPTTRAVFRVSHTSGAACYASGTPRVELQDEKGHSWTLPAADRSSGRVRTGRGGSTRFTFSYRPAHAGAKDAFTPATVLVTLPGSSTPSTTYWPFGAVRRTSDAVVNPIGS